MISLQRKLQIKNMAESMLSKSLSEIAEENRVNVITGDLSHIKDGNVSGAILKNMVNANGKYDYTIYINSNNASTRKRFTFAHELGHFFLHKEYLDTKNMIIDNDPIYLYRDEEYKNLDDDSKIREYEANEFAGCLLMPEAEVNERKYTMSVTQLAKLFNVSEQAMTVRLYNLTMGNYE